MLFRVQDTMHRYVSKRKSFRSFALMFVFFILKLVPLVKLFVR